MRAMVPIGRALFALIFVASVLGHFSAAGIAQASEKANFLKNTSLIGTCLLVMYYGSGPYSLHS